MSIQPRIVYFAQAQTPHFDQTDHHCHAASAKHHPNHQRLLFWPINITHHFIVARRSVTLVVRWHDQFEGVNVKVKDQKRRLHRRPTEHHQRIGQEEL